MLYNDMMNQLSAGSRHVPGERSLALLERIQRSGRAVVRVDRDHDIFRENDNAQRLALTRLTKGGWLVRLERGAYVVPGPGRTRRHGQLAIAADWLQGELYAITGFFALAHWDLTNQPPTTMDVLLPRFKNNVEFGGTRFRFIQAPAARLTSASAREVDVPGARARARIVTPERALVDVLAGRYASDIETVNDAFERGFRLGTLRRAGLLHELSAAPTVAARRLGWVAEHRGDKDLAAQLDPLVGNHGYAPVDPSRAVGAAQRNTRWRLLENGWL